MVGAVALRKQSENHEPPATRVEVLARYRQLRQISMQHHCGALGFVSKDAIMHHARRLGLADRNTLILDSMDELTLAFDLAIHTAPAGRSRAIDRYARATPFAPGSDEAAVLEAMRDASFAVVLVRGRHQSAGLIVTDLFREIELWLLDEGLEVSLEPGTAFATRYFTPERFSMTAGVGMPVDFDLLEDAIDFVPQLMRKPRVEAIQDRRFAEAVYRAALADGIMEGMTYRDPTSADDAA